MLEEDTKDLVAGIFKHGSAGDLMNVCKAGAQLVQNSTVPFEELDKLDQVSITTLQVVLTFLTEFGVLEDVQILH